MVPEILRHRDFRDVWLASLASNAGSWLQIVASGWLILQATGSPAAVGALALVTRAPAIALFGLRRRARRPLRPALGRHLDVPAAGRRGGRARGRSPGLDGTHVWAIYLFTFLVGDGFALGLPAMLALIPALVPRARLSQAVSMNAAGINVARLAGPAIGGGDAGDLRRHGLLRRERGLVPGPGGRARAARAPAGRACGAGAVGMREALAYAARDRRSGGC